MVFSSVVVEYMFVVSVRFFVARTVLKSVTVRSSVETSDLIIVSVVAELSHRVSYPCKRFPSRTHYSVVVLTSVIGLHGGVIVVV